MEFKFSINNDHLMPEECISGVSGNVNTYICSFDIKCEYTGLTWFCVFKQGDTVYRQIIQNGVCMIPYEVLETKGMVYIGCYATNADEADLKRISTNWVSLFVDEGAYSEGSVPDVPTADAWEIYVNSKVEPLLKEIETAESQRQTAENNRLSAENNRNIAESNRQTAEDDRATAESERATAETQRLNAEANRNSNETDRISAETARVEAENTRAESEAQRALSESKRQSAETERNIAELSRVEAETARNEAESVRKNAENTRSTAENTRRDSEISRVNAENSRISAENKRVTAENNRTTAETARADAETKRAANEISRDTAEKNRATAEENRETAENNRITSETSRVNAESARAEAESARIEAEAARAEELAKKADKLKAIPHTTASGYPLTVTDHLEGETVINYQVYGNSVQDGTPTPETPIEIQSVGDLITDETSEYYGKYDVPVTACGKNLFDMETILPEQGWVKQDDGSYYVASNGTVRNKVLWENTENYTGQLKILFQAKYAVDNTRGSYLWVNYTDGTYLVVYYAGTVVANTWYYPESSRTITDSNKIVQNIVWTYGTGATSTWVKDIIITKDLTATEYEQYSGETKHIYLNEPLRKVGDYADYVDFKNQKVIRQIKYIRLEPTLNYNMWVYDDVFYGFLVFLTESIKECMVLSNYFKPYNTLPSKKDNSIYLRDALYIGTSDWTTVDDFKAWLSDNIAYVAYVLKTPTEEPITVPELTAPTSENMNISANTVIEPSNIDLTYYQDINKVITNLTNAILAQGGNV